LQLIPFLHGTFTANFIKHRAKCKCDLKTCYKALSVQFYCLWFA